MKNKFIFAILLLMIPGFVHAKVRIADTEYETLDQAMSVVKAGETIVLLDDVDVTDTTKYQAYHNWLFPDNATLDLNGHTIITGRYNGTPSAVWLGNNLTIKNGSFISKYKDPNSDQYFEADYSLFVGDEIETSNITLENLTVSTGINIYNSLNVTIKNVTSIGRGYYSVWLDEHATATIESGNYSTKGVAVIGITSNSEFKSKLTIKGGTFTAATKDKLYLPEGAEQKYQRPIIQGGNYDFDVTELLTEEYECRENNGKYTVTEKQYDRDIVIDNNIENMEMTTDNEKTAQIFRDTLKLANGIQADKKDVAIVLDIEKTSPAQELINTMNKKLKNANMVNCFDIQIHVIDKSTTQTIGKLEELTDKITLSIKIPEEIEKVKEGYTRKYYILREHNNTVDILETTMSKDQKTLMFETEKFSTYMLAYQDEKNETEETKPIDNPKVDIENPSTGDGVMTSVLLTGITSTMILGSIIYLNRKKEQNG